MSLFSFDSSIFFRRQPVRVVLTLALAGLAAGLCLKLQTPLPWMIGPLLATGAATMLGGPTASWMPLRHGGQWVIGCALGLYFSPQVIAVLAGLWWVVALGAVWALGLGVLVGAWLHRLHARPGLFHMPGLSRITTYFASPIGGASEMTLMGERYGARPDLVASAHSLRVLLVTLIIPFGLQWAGLHGIDLNVPAARQLDWPGLAGLAALTGLGCWVMHRLRQTNPWLMGALVVSLLITASGVNLSALPPWLTNAAQLVIGISLGVRFTPGFVHMAPRWLASIALTTLTMICLCAGFAWLLAQAAGLHWATLLLATSPGGIAEMAITAKVLKLGVPVVTAFHVVRLLVVLVLAEPIYRWCYQRSPGQPSPQ